VTGGAKLWQGRWLFGFLVQFLYTLGAGETILQPQKCGFDMDGMMGRVL
jgi:hypothetical protein